MGSKRTFLFDFCDTLVDFQTANAFVEFVMERKGLRKGLIDIVRRSLNRLSLMQTLNSLFPRISVNKAMLLYQLKGIAYKELDRLGEQFYREVICLHFVKPVLNELISAVEHGDLVAVVSGGYDIYLKYFTAEYRVSALLATSLKFRNGVFTGKIKGRDCMGDEKVKRIQDYFRTNEPQAIDSDVVGYSDSPSDLPMLSLCKESVIIVPDEHVPTWAEHLKPRIIVQERGC